MDEKPNIQALECHRTTRPMRPGLIERQELEYVRHGTVNFLVKLMVHTGLMRGWCLEHNDSASPRVIAHLDTSWPEYNPLYAHPFTCPWTRAKMHQWLNRHRP